MKKSQKKRCCKCNNPSLSGLKGLGYCRYHWAVTLWGKSWADKVVPTKGEPC